MFIAIMRIENNRAAKFMEFGTQAAADAHISKYIDRFPDAFVIETDAPAMNLLIDGKSATVSPPAQPDPVIIKSLDQMIEEKVRAVIAEENADAIGK